MTASGRAWGWAGAVALAFLPTQTPPATVSPLPLRVVTTVARGTATDGSKLRVTAIVDASNPDTRFTSLTAKLVDANGSPSATWTASASALTGGQVTFSVAALPGHYTLRIAASDRTSRTGALEAAVDLALVTAGPLRLGTLNLGVAGSLPAPPPPPVRGGRAEMVMPVPAARPEFSNESDAVAFFDLYGGVANEHISVVFEIRRHADGPPVQLLQPKIQPARAGEPDHYLVTAPIDLASLSPGDYEVRATVGIAGQTPAVITRMLRKTASSPAIN